jgi:hypothetical protein
MNLMRTQLERDQQTVDIGTALGVFVLIVAAEVLGLWLLHSVFDIASGHTDALLGWAVAIAGTIAIANLVRSEKS